MRSRVRGEVWGGEEGEEGEEDGEEGGNWGEEKMSRRAVARVVLPEEVGPERARRMGGCCCCCFCCCCWLGGEVVVVVVGLEAAEVGMVGGEGGGGYGLGLYDVRVKGESFESITEELLAMEYKMGVSGASFETKLVVSFRR